MLTRSLKLALLASFAYWAIGAAVFVHERMENQEETRACASASGGQAEAGQNAPPVHPHHDHDHCAVCQLLAHMSAVRSGASPLVSAPAPALEPRVTAESLLAGRGVVSNAHIRGPPATAAV